MGPTKEAVPGEARSRFPSAGAFRESIYRQSWRRLILLWFFLSVAISLSFAFLYWWLGDSELKVGGVRELVGFGDVWHFSVTTQSTIGFGHLSPVPEIYLLVSLHSMLGTAVNALMFAVIVLRLTRHSPALEIVALCWNQMEGRRNIEFRVVNRCLLYTSPSPRDQRGSRMPSSA